MKLPRVPPLAWLAGGAALLGAWIMMTKHFRLGAWSGWAAVSDPATAIARCKRLGVTRLNLFVNDNHKGADSAEWKSWHTYDLSRVADACDRIADAGIAVGVSTWVSPSTGRSADWPAGVARLAEWVDRQDAVECLELDVEEPWAVYCRDAAHAEHEAAALFERLSAATDKAIEVTHQVYGHPALAPRVLPMVRRANVLIPQSYATKLNVPPGAPPGRLERNTLAKYRPLGAPIILGMMASNLDGVFGLPSPQSFGVSLDQCRALVDEVRVWRLETMALPDVVAVVDAWRARQTSEVA